MPHGAGVTESRPVTSCEGAAQHFGRPPRTRTPAPFSGTSCRSPEVLGKRSGVRLWDYRHEADLRGRSEAAPHQGRASCRMSFRSGPGAQASELNDAIAAMGADVRSGTSAPASLSVHLRTTSANSGAPFRTTLWNRTSGRFHANPPPLDPLCAPTRTEPNSAAPPDQANDVFLGHTLENPRMLLSRTLIHVDVSKHVATRFVVGCCTLSCCLRVSWGVGDVC